MPGPARCRRNRPAPSSLRTAANIACAFNPASRAIYLEQIWLSATQKTLPAPGQAAPSASMTYVDEIVLKATRTP